MNSATEVFSVAEAAKLLRLSRNSTYQAIYHGEIPSIRIGKRILVPRVALEKMLSGPVTQSVDNH